MTAKKDSESGEALLDAFTNSDIIQNIIEQGKVAAAILIDLEKAFDSIWIDCLMYKLREAGINSYLLNINDPLSPKQKRLVTGNKTRKKN